ncbi:MAG: hypothetical protein U0Q16_07830 [Bryobacteraceae bacterium]
MPQHFIFGETIVSREELIARTSKRTETTERFTRALHANDSRTDITIPFSGGHVSPAAVLAAAPTAGAFSPIGTGLPALVMIRHVYTGRFPKSVFGGGRKEMLLTSAVKDMVTFNAAPRALNVLKKRVPAKSNMMGPSATEEGTAVVFYSPAVTSPSTSIAFDIFFNDFNNELVGKVGDAFSSAAGLPIFGPYSGVLLAAGLAIKLGGNLADSLVDGGPEQTFSDNLDFEIPGVEVPLAGYRILCSQDLNLTDFDFKIGKGLVDKATGTVYDGDEPYLVYLVDGKKNEAFAKFTPTAVAASVLSRFYNQKGGTEVAIDTVVDGLRLVNDMKFRGQAEDLQKKIDALPADDPEREALTKKRKALIANIVEDVLKPKA